MRRQVLLLNLALVAVAAVLGWRIRTAWVEAQERERQVLEKDAPAAQVLPPPATPAVTPATPADYIDVAQRTLFSRDRDPNVYFEVQAPPAPPPPPPLPALPAYFGQMALSDPVVVLGYEGKQKSYRAGEKIGEFTIVGWDQERITFDWNGEAVERELALLRPAEGERAPSSSAKANAAQPQGPARAQTGAMGAAPAAAQAATNTRSKSGEMGAAKEEAGEGRPGRDMGAFRTCEPGDTAPAGTVVDGYRKVISRSLMDSVCRWEPIN